MLNKDILCKVRWCLLGVSGGWELHILFMYFRQFAITPLLRNQCGHPHEHTLVEIGPVVLENLVCRNIIVFPLFLQFSPLKLGKVNIREFPL